MVCALLWLLDSTVFWLFEFLTSSIHLLIYIQIKWPEQEDEILDMIINSLKALDATIPKCGLRPNQWLVSVHKISRALDKALKHMQPDLVTLVPKLVDLSDNPLAASVLLDQLTKPDADPKSKHEKLLCGIILHYTCNGFYCEGFKPNKNYKPKMFTENWTGWYTEFGGAVPYRPIEDLAFSVARFIQNNVSFMNYYMHHSGTDFGRTATGLFIATSYDYDAPIDEYGLLREPKWGHLTNLHKAIKQCEPALVSLYPTVTWRGNNLEVHVFKTKLACVAFLANYDTNSPATVTFQNAQYYLSPWSVSILTDCKNAIFNTAKITASSYQPKMTPVSGQSIRRHWPEYKASGNCGACSYAGTFTEKKCRFNCKQSSQRWYHVPRSWLKASGNSLVVFEEWGGIPTGISIVKRTF